MFFSPVLNKYVFSILSAYHKLCFLLKNMSFDEIVQKVWPLLMAVVEA